MSFKTQIQKDLDGFVNPDEFAEQAEYYPLHGSGPVVCNVILTHSVLFQPSDYNSSIAEQGITIDALIRDVKDPALKSYFIIEGVKYIVQRILDSDGDFISMAVAAE